MGIIEAPSFGLGFHGLRNSSQKTSYHLVSKKPSPFSIPVFFFSEPAYFNEAKREPATNQIEQALPHYDGHLNESEGF